MVIDFLQFIEAGSVRISQKFKELTGQKLIVVSNKFGYTIAATVTGRRQNSQTWRSPPFNSLTEARRSCIYGNAEADIGD